MAAADVVVMCSVWESYGLVVAEALALGRPLVATAVGPVPRIWSIDGVTGRLVPPSDPRGAGRSDRRAARRSGHGRGGSGPPAREHLATKLGPGTLIDRVAAVYLDVLEDR